MVGFGMSSSPQTTVVFDLVSKPEAIAVPWSFLGWFWVAGVAVVLIVVVIWIFKGPRWQRWGSALFGPIWWGAVVYATWMEVGMAEKARAAARDGTFLTVKGCLSEFHPGLPKASKTSTADEYWTVAGETFRYGTNRPGFAWKLVEPLGGAVHADSYVEVGFVRNLKNGNGEIIRLAVAPHSCPRAPDPGPR